MNELSNTNPEFGEASSILTAIAGDVVANGGVYKKDGLDKPSQVGLHVKELSTEELEHFENLARNIDTIFNVVIPSLLVNTTVQDLLGVSSEYVEKLLATVQDGRQAAVMWGVDILDGKVIDPNAEWAVAFGYQQTVAEAFGKVMPEVMERAGKVDDAMLEEIKSLTGKENPHILLLVDENDAYIDGYEVFAKRTGAEIATVDEFSTSGQEYDAIIRYADTSSPSTYDKFWSNVGNAIVINSQVCTLVEFKGWVPILAAAAKGNLGLKLPEGFQFDSSLFPKSWMVSSEYILDSEGNVYKRTPELIEQLFAQGRKNKVHKPAFGYGGGEVTFGRYLDNGAKWRNLLISNESYIIEELQLPEEVRIFVGVQDKVENQILVEERKLRTMHRLYKIGTKIYMEMFGAVPGNKINGAGFAMPVLFPEGYYGTEKERALRR